MGSMDRHLAVLDHLGRTLAFKPASTEELKSAVLCLIEVVTDLATEARAQASGSPPAAEAASASRRS